jgi:hypothetical protein
VKELNAGEGRGTIALAEFIDLVATGQPSIVVGVYSSSGFSLPIEQQPVDHPEYVTKKEGVATQFRLAAEYGTIGLLAHNDLGGALFFDLSIGQKIYVVYGDARTEQFEISEIRRYQARQPNSPYSSFIDLDAEESEVAALDLFYEIYGETGHLVFQTCIGKDGIDTWGRYFVIARSKSLDNIRF